MNSKNLTIIFFLIVLLQVRAATALGYDLPEPMSAEDAARLQKIGEENAKKYGSGPPVESVTPTVQPTTVVQAVQEETEVEEATQDAENTSVSPDSEEVTPSKQNIFQVFMEKVRGILKNIFRSRTSEK